MTSRKIQFYSQKVKLSDKQAKIILEEANKVYELMIQTITWIDEKNKGGWEAKVFLDHYLKAHPELDEAIKAW